MDESGAGAGRAPDEARVSGRDQVPRPRGGGLLGIRSLTIAIGIGATILGGYLGYRVGYESSRGGLEGMTASFGQFALVMGVSLLLFALAVLLRLLPEARGRLASSLALRATGLLIASSFVVGALVAPLGLGFRPPFVMAAPGTISIVLVDIPGFVPAADPAAECTFVLGGDAVGEVSSLDLGELEGATLRGRIRAGDLRLPDALELWIDGADLPDGGPQPFWFGPAEMLEVAADGASGRVAFAGLVPDTAGRSGGPSWPSLGGELVWDCAPLP